MSNITLDESVLDQLFTLQQKRLQNIEEHGIDFDLLGSEKTIIGIYNEKASTVTIAANAQLRPGITIKSSNTGELYIVSIAHKAGIDVAEVLPVLSEIQVMTVKNDGYMLAGSLPIVGYSADSINVPAHKTIAVNTIVKRDGKLLRVSAVRRDGAVSKLTLTPLPGQPKAPGLKYGQPPEVRGPITKGFSTLRS